MEDRTKCEHPAPQPEKTTKTEQSPSGSSSKKDDKSKSGQKSLRSVFFAEMTSPENPKSKDKCSSDDETSTVSPDIEQIIGKRISLDRTTSTPLSSTRNVQLDDVDGPFSPVQQYFTCKSYEKGGNI